MNWLLAAFFAFFVADDLYACEAVDVNILANQVRPGREVSDEYSKCKIRPSANDELVVSLLFERDGLNLEKIFDVDLLIYSMSKKEIISHYRRDSMFRSAGSILDSVSIDTGLYNIARGMRAFGLRADYHTASGPSPTAQQVLQLFAVDGSRIKRVLEKVIMKTSHSEVDQSPGQERCEESSEEMISTISMSPKSTNGYFDMIVNQKLSEYKSKIRSGRCVEIKNNYRAAIILKYDGNLYRVPAAMAMSIGD